MTATTGAARQRTTWQKIARRIRVPAGFIFAVVYLFVSKKTVTTASVAYSLVLVIPGLLLRAYASGYVKKNSELTTTGPYAHTRNPLYLGSILIAAGFGAASLNPWLLLALVLLFLGIYLPVIRGEEEYLRAHFAGFDAYAAHVPRLLPRPTPYTAPIEIAATASESAAAQPAAHFSITRYRRHREYNALMGACGIYAMLMLILYLTH
jgi:protein-S-isoprenylcysteine O-methyltransferase Ste14